MCWPLAAVPAAAQAQAAGAASSDSLIVVTGEGLPLPPGTPAYGSVVIDRERLVNLSSGRIETALGDVAGFQQFRRSDSRSANPSAQGATLRALGGNASSRTLMLLDGVPLADPFFGYIPFNALTPERLSAIRVTRGGGSGAFGAGAVAGTIELVSATRDQIPLASFSALHGSRDATELAAAFSPDLGGGHISLSGRWDRSDGFMTTPRAQRSSASVPAAYDSWSANLRAVAPLSATTELQVRAALFQDARTLRFRGADSTSEGQDASIRLVSRGRWQVDALAYVQARNFSNIVISATTFRKSLDQRNTPSTGIGGKIELRPPVGGAHVLRVGVDSRFATGDMEEAAYDANLSTNPLTARRYAGGDQWTAGLFIEDDWTIGPLVFTGGMRADHWAITKGFFRATGVGATDQRFADRDQWELSGRAGLRMDLGGGIAFRAAAYSGFRLPTLNELYRPFVVGAVRTQANVALKPEKLRGAEAGIDFAPCVGCSLGVTGFTNRLDNAIANVTTGANLRQRNNVDAIIAKGVEVAAAVQAGAFGVNASYAYSHSRVNAPGMQFDGLPPAQSPAHAASATLSWRPIKDALVSATVRYVSRQYEDDLATDTLPGAFTMDAIARLPLGHGFTLLARAENLFDETVVTRNAGGSIDLGTPRTLWLGISFSR